MPEIRFHHISLTCQDPIAVERFYTKHFGFMRARVVPLGDRQIVFLRGAGIRLSCSRRRRIGQSRRRSEMGIPGQASATSHSNSTISMPS